MVDQEKQRFMIGVVAALAVAASAVGFVSVRGNAAGSTSTTAEYRNWETPRPFKAPPELILNVFAEPNQSSPILVKLQPTAIAYGLGEYGIKGAPKSQTWRKVRTGSNTIGWVKAEYGESVTITEAEEVLLRNQEQLEDYVRQAITTAVIVKINAEGLHGGGTPDEIRITAPLSTTESSPVLVAPVSALMHGAIWASNKYQIDATVELFLHVDKDFLPASKVEIKDVEIVGNTMTSGLSGMDAVRLFSGLGLF